jgi:hypothetical protein
MFNIDLTPFDLGHVLVIGAHAKDEAAHALNRSSFNTLTTKKWTDAAILKQISIREYSLIKPTID